MEQTISRFARLAAVCGWAVAGSLLPPQPAVQAQMKTVRR
jgi:hypothetical protein